MSKIDWNKPFLTGKDFGWEEIHCPVCGVEIEYRIWHSSREPVQVIGCPHHKGEWNPATGGDIAGAYRHGANHVTTHGGGHKTKTYMFWQMPATWDGDAYLPTLRDWVQSIGGCRNLRTPPDIWVVVDAYISQAETLLLQWSRSRHSNPDATVVLPGWMPPTPRRIVDVVRSLLISTWGDTASGYDYWHHLQKSFPPNPRIPWTNNFTALQNRYDRAVRILSLAGVSFPH